MAYVYVYIYMYMYMEFISASTELIRVIACNLTHYFTGTGLLLAECIFSHFLCMPVVHPLNTSVMSVLIDLIAENNGHIVTKESLMYCPDTKDRTYSRFEHALNREAMHSTCIE